MESYWPHILPCPSTTHQKYSSTLQGHVDYFPDIGQTDREVQHQPKSFADGHLSNFPVRPSSRLGATLLVLPDDSNDFLLARRVGRRTPEQRISVLGYADDRIILGGRYASHTQQSGDDRSPSDSAPPQSPKYCVRAGTTIVDIFLTHLFIIYLYMDLTKFGLFKKRSFPGVFE